MLDLGGQLVGCITDLLSGFLELMRGSVGSLLNQVADLLRDFGNLVLDALHDRFSLADHLADLPVGIAVHLFGAVRRCIDLVRYRRRRLGITASIFQHESLFLCFRFRKCLGWVEQTRAMQRACQVLRIPSLSREVFDCATNGGIDCAHVLAQMCVSDPLGVSNSLPRTPPLHGAWQVRVFLLLALLCWPSSGVGADKFRAASFDLTAARRSDTLDAKELPESRKTTEQVTLREVRFSSLSWDEAGIAKIIRIAAFLAVPKDSGPLHRLPAVIIAHGLGSQADPADTIEIARNLKVVALSISAPGNGASEGIGPTPQDSRSIFTIGRAGPADRGVIDIRSSWLYQYAYALLRAVTYVSTLPEVDPKGTFVTGFSMGGLATFVVGGVDDRVRGILPIAACGGLAVAAAQDTWLQRLVRASGGLTPSDSGPRAIFQQLDPLAFAAQQHGAVYLLIGAQDEYFPLDQVVRTYRALRAPEKSLEVVADYDHGWYFGSGCPASCMPGGTGTKTPCPASCPTVCPAGAEPPYCGPQGSYNRQSAFLSRRSLLLRALVSQHAAHPQRPHFSPPPTPFVQRVRDQVVVRVPMTPPPRVVRLAISKNAGYTFGQYVLPRESDGAWHFRQAVPADAILIAEAEAADGTTATSIPIVPRSYQPQVRPFLSIPR